MTIHESETRFKIGPFRFGAKPGKEIPPSTTLTFEHNLHFFTDLSEEIIKISRDSDSVEYTRVTVPFVGPPSHHAKTLGKEAINKDRALRKKILWRP